jgi:3-deoxy-7-phosphoheptulonate synthase
MTATPQNPDRPMWDGMLPGEFFARLGRRPITAAGIVAALDALRESMDDRTLELVALRVSARRDCHYVWRGHVRIAHLNIDAPLSQVEIARIAAGPDALSGRDAAVLRAVDELLDAQRMSDASRRALGDSAVDVLAATYCYELACALMADAAPELDARAIDGLGTPLIAARSVRRPGAERFTIAGLPIGPSTFTVIAGPCSVVTAEQTLRVAQRLRDAGATMLRGGAYKPRSSHDAFQGRGAEGLAMLADAKAATGLPVVTELLDVRDLERVLSVADVIQVGARSMQNTPLLRALGEAGRPVLLKRGLAATIEETIHAAGYVLAGGNERVVLCERGIRTFERGYRFTLDLTAVPLMQQLSGLPVFVDPSHAPGRRDLVTRLSKAAIAVGADGLIVEVDEDPDHALSDGPQQLDISDFASYMTAIRRAVGAEDRKLL